MEILKDKDVFLNPEHETPEKFEDRQTVKIIIKNDKGEVAFVTNPIHKFFILPGGGAESDDLKKEAEREALEEVNYHIDITREIGKIEEFRNRNAKHYITTCFLAKAIKEGEEDLRTDGEKENGLETKWLSVEEAKSVLDKQVEEVKKGEVKFYNTAFNIIRDSYFVGLI